MKPNRSFAARAAITAALAGAAIVLTAAPANATTDSAPVDYWGAIAISVQTGNVGYTYDQPNADIAARVSAEQCGAADCQSVVQVANGCAAVAQAPNRAWGWAWAGSRAEAEARAIAATPGEGARTITWVCTTGHQP